MGRTKLKPLVLGLVACGLAIVWSASAANADAPALVGLEPDKPLILPITVQAAYNDDTMFFNIEWEGNRGNTHDLVRFNGTDWQKEGGPRREAQSTIDDDPLRGPTNLTSTNYESRVTWMLNDPNGPNAVPNFEQTGCYGTCHDNSRAMPEWDASTGGANKKYLRADLNPDTAKLDLWHHRQARANPIGMSDDQYVKVTDGSGGRKGDAGGGPYQTNSIVDGHPTWVLDDTDTGGKFAFNFEDTHTDPDNAFMQDGDVPPTSVATALPYQEALDRGYVPQEGDTVPNRRLRDRRGTSRGDITAAGSSFTPINGPDTPPEKMDHFGVIESSVQRALDTGNDDDTALSDGEVYDIAFAVHTGMVTVRDHYVGFPLKLSLGAAEGGDIEATKLAGSGADVLPNWDDIPELDLELFLPGITSLEFLRNENVGKEYYDPDQKVLVDQFHGGASDVIDGTKSCADCHTVSGGGFMSMESLVPKRGGVWTPTPTLVPEPASLLLAMLAGVVGLTLASRRRRQK